MKKTPTKQNGYLLLCAYKTRGRSKLTVIVIASKSPRYESQFIAKVSVRCVFDRLYQENWLEQVTTKEGQSNWSIASLCSD